jgi:hypothetical protein
VSSLVDAALDRVLAGVSEIEDESGFVPLTCVSSLAEGADRLVAQRVLERPGAGLIVVLPLPAEDYATDFGSPESLQEFNDLLTAADEVVVAPSDPADPSREAAYERAGLAMLDRSDVLLALWDGQPARGRGGTAHIVEEAHERGLVVDVITVERAPA